MVAVHKALCISAVRPGPQLTTQTDVPAGVMQLKCSHCSRICASELKIKRWISVFHSIDKSKLTKIFRIVSYVLSISRMLWLKEFFSIVNIKRSDARNEHLFVVCLFTVIAVLGMLRNSVVALNIDCHIVKLHLTNKGHNKTNPLVARPTTECLQHHYVSVHKKYCVTCIDSTGLNTVNSSSKADFSIHISFVSLSCLWTMWSVVLGSLRTPYFYEIASNLEPTQNDAFLSENLRYYYTNVHKCWNLSPNYSFVIIVWHYFRHLDISK